MARKVTNPQRQQFIKLLPKHRIDPFARAAAPFHIIDRCLRKAKYRLRPGEQQLETVTQAVLDLLQTARTLSRLRFWDELELYEEPPWGAAEEPLAADRQEQIDAAIDLLRDKSVRLEDVIAAMVTVEHVFNSMRDQFVFGVMPDGFEGISDEERYMCSALLGPIVNLINNFWVPLRDKVRNATEVATQTERRMTWKSIRER